MNKYEHKENNILQCILSADEKQYLLADIIEYFPYPVEVFNSDGTMIMINKAAVMASGIADGPALLGKYNLLSDPIINKQGFLEKLKQAFAGETVFIKNVKAPIKGLREIYNLCFQGLESIYHDVIAFPIINDNDKVAYVAVIMLIRNTYMGKDTVVKAMEYMDNNWNKCFSIEDVAKAAHLSTHYFSRLFKNEVGITPYQYYLNIKILKIKEKLSDANVSIKEAFAACGIDYNGYYANVFQQKVGLKPSQYRALVQKEYPKQL